jgi:hypothetical protein
MTEEEAAAAAASAPAPATPPPTSPSGPASSSSGTGLGFTATAGRGAAGGTTAGTGSGSGATTGDFTSAAAKQVVSCSGYAVQQLLRIKPRILILPTVPCPQVRQELSREWGSNQPHLL